MCSRVLIFILLAMARNHGTMGFVFGPLAMFTPSQDASSPAPSESTNQWTFGADADADADTTTATTPFPKWRPSPHRRRPNPGSSNIVFPSSDGKFPSFTESKKPMLYPQDNTAPETEHRLSPEFMSRPGRPKQASQGSEDTIWFDGPSSSRGRGSRNRGRPNRRPMLTAPVSLVPEATPPDLATDLASPQPSPPCPCPTTSEFNPVCAEIQGERVTMNNMSQFKCAQFCLGRTDVRLLFHGRCQKIITLLKPFIHD